MSGPPGLSALAGRAGAIAATAVAQVRREFPHDLRHLVTGPDDVPRPRDAHPAFYGAFDWHSSVEMHWVLVRLAKLLPGEVPDTARAVLDEHLSAHALGAEAAYLSHPARRSFERPYGWGWVLTLAEELADWDDPGARRWAAALGPLADVVADGLLGWLARSDYPVRYGFHNNSAFSLIRSIGWARRSAEAGDPRLLDAIGGAARRWFGGDVDAPARWEPSGSDFLSPVLTEAVLMAEVFDPGAFSDWVTGFLPELTAGGPDGLFRPVGVSDPTDGQIAHLHGLNLSRAWCFRRLADVLPGAAGVLGDAHGRHVDASLAAVTDEHDMVTHWLAAYALLALS